MAGITWNGRPLGEWIERESEVREGPEGHRKQTVAERLQGNGIVRTRVTCECGKQYSGIGYDPFRRIDKHRESEK